MEPQSIPKISASLSITIYADDLSPKLMLTCGAIIITDLTTGTEVRQKTRTHCRIPPPFKVTVTLNHQLFHTLLPNTPLRLSAPFTRSRGGRAAANGGSGSSSSEKSQANHDPDSAARDDNGLSSASSSSTTTKHGAYGGGGGGGVVVDGLEPGHRYLLSIAAENKSRVPWHVVRWWEFGTKEEVLSAGTATGDGDGDGGGLDGRQVRFGPGPHEAIVIDSKTVGVVEFECRD